MIANAAINKPLREVRWLRKVKLLLGILWAGAIIGLLIAFKGFGKVDFFYLTEAFVSVDNIIKVIGYYYGSYRSY